MFPNRTQMALPLLVNKEFHDKEKLACLRGSTVTITCSMEALIVTKKYTNLFYIFSLLSKHFIKQTLC